jgi:methylated-DNA-[protein]-cysteine S-methyltransferase
MKLITGYFLSPIGWLEIKAYSTYIISLKFVDNINLPFRKSKSKLIIKLTKQLNGYFKHKRRVFDLPCNLNGTEFQLKVWGKVLAVPYGKTTSYTKIAIQLGSSKNARAVGNAVGGNPIPILIPCHRVIGENKEMVGYSGGLWRKQWLLEHEGYDNQLLLQFKSQKTHSSKRQ